jgi:anti-sigma factor RsiW
LTVSSRSDAPPNESLTAPNVSDAELNAYIDGELSRDRRHAIERLVACDAGIRTRIEGLLSVRELVRRVYSPTNKV